MSLRTFGALSSALIAAGMCLAGCSARQAPPATPVDAAATPTHRSSANSYDQPNTPMYTQPGVNGGTPASVQAIPTVKRYDPNAPLALAVYGAIQSKLGQSEARYLTAATMGTAVELGGTVTSRVLENKAISAAQHAPGVKTVVNHIQVKGA